MDAPETLAGLERESARQQERESVLQQGARKAARLAEQVGFVTVSLALHPALACKRKIVVHKKAEAKNVNFVEVHRAAPVATTHPDA